jgi:hypothetical protein
MIRHHWWKVKQGILPATNLLLRLHVVRCLWVRITMRDCRLKLFMNQRDVFFAKQFLGDKKQSCAIDFDISPADVLKTRMNLARAHKQG